MSSKNTKQSKCICGADAAKSGCRMCAECGACYKAHRKANPRSKASWKTLPKAVDTLGSHRVARALGVSVRDVWEVYIGRAEYPEAWTSVLIRAMRSEAERNLRWHARGVSVTRFIFSGVGFVFPEGGI